MNIPYEKGLDPRSQIYIFTPSRLAERLLYHLDRAGHYFANAHYRVERSSYPGFLLASVRQGTLTVRFRGESREARPGDFLFINCREPHAYQAVEHTEFLWMHLGGGSTGGFLEETYRTSGTVLRPANTNWILLQMNRIFDQLEEYGTLEEQAASTRIYSILCALLYSGGAESSDSPIISRAQQYLREHLGENPSVPALAAHCHLSASQFTRLFRQHTGQSPHEYTVNLRIQQAKLLLVETDLPVTEIAARVGYGYSTSFETAFRKKVGVSPRKFRQLSL